MLEQIAKRKDGPSFEDIVEKKFGKLDLFNEHGKEYPLRKNSPLLQIKREQLMAGQKKWKPKTVEDFGFVPAKLLNEEYRISAEN